MQTKHRPVVVASIRVEQNDVDEAKGQAEERDRAEEGIRCVQNGGVAFDGDDGQCSDGEREANDGEDQNGDAKTRVR